MIRKVSVDQLRIGVYIEKIDENWFSTPFIRHHFKVTSRQQIQTLQKHDIKEVFIDDQKGIALSCPEDSINSIKPGKIREYLPVSVDRFVVNTVLPFQIYVKKEGDYSLYLDKNLPFHSEVSLDLDANQIEEVYVSVSEKDALLRYEQETNAESERSRQNLSDGFESTEKVKAYNHYLRNYIPTNALIFEPGIKVPFNSLF